MAAGEGLLLISAVAIIALLVTLFIEKAKITWISESFSQIAVGAISMYFVNRLFRHDRTLPPPKYVPAVRKINNCVYERSN